MLLIPILIFSPENHATEYEIYQNLETTLLAGGTALITLGFTLKKQVQPPDPARLNQDGLPFWDRFAVNMDHGQAAHWSDWTLITCSLIPIVALLETPKKFCRTHGLMIAESLMWTTGATYVVKASTRRARPYAYRTSFESLPRDASMSFFSGHTAMAFQGAVLGGILLQQTKGHSDLRNVVGFAGLGCALMTGAFRVLSGNHFPSDVLAGALVGSLVGWVIPKLHESNEKTPDPIVRVPKAVRIQVLFRL